MKTLLAFILVAGIYSGNPPKENDFITFYRKYKGETGMTNFTLPGFVFHIATIGQNDDIKKIVHSTSRFRIMVMEENSEFLFKTVNKYLNPEKYKDLLYVRDGDTSVKITAHISNKKIKEIILIVHESESFVAVQLKGNYTFDQIQELVKQI